MQSHLVDANHLQPLAKKYIWWKTPADAALTPERIVAQVMDIGDYEDVQSLAKAVGDDYLKAVLVGAEIGQFSPRSWVYWHYRLGLSTVGRAPPMPQRRLG